MKVAILATTACLPSRKVIEHFQNNGFDIEVVIIENNFRHKFSEREKQYRTNHDKFNRLSKKYSFVRRITRRLWDFSPLFLKVFLQTKVYYIPFIKHFSLRHFCEKRNIDTVEVKRHSSKETVRIIEERQLDYLLMISSNWLLKDPIISLKQTKIINAHSGHLPKHKGLDSIGWSILDGDKVGLTTHFIDAGIDSGAILRFYEATISKGDSFTDVANNVGKLQPEAFLDTLKRLEKNEIIPQIQDHTYKPHRPMSFEELCMVEDALAK